MARRWWPQAAAAAVKITETAVLADLAVVAAVAFLRVLREQEPLGKVTTAVCKAAHHKAAVVVAVLGQ